MKSSATKQSSVQLVSSSPTCPRCQTAMAPRARAPRLPERAFASEHDRRAPAQLAVWRCETCGIERPRFS